MLQRALGLFALLAAMLVAVADAQAEKRVALIVGNAHYDHASTLRNPVNDAQDMEKVLKNLGFEVMVRTDLDQHAFARTIDEFGRMLNGADVGLFFYAGHGLQANGKNYLVSTKAKLENEFLIPAETIEVDSIIQLMESRTKLNLVFLDACRNNPLADKLRLNLVAANRAIALGRGLARVEPTGRDTLIAFAAAPGQEAADGRGRNSPFTSALLHYLPEPGVEVSVMLKRVTAQVRQETRNSQRPQQLSDMSQTFYFAKAEPAVAMVSPTTGPNAAKPGPDYAIELAYWDSARSVNDCASVRVYLDRFPNGVFADLAKLSEQRLCGKLTIADATPVKPQPPSGLTIARSSVGQGAAPDKTKLAAASQPVTPAEAKGSVVVSDPTPSEVKTSKPAETESKSANAEVKVAALPEKPEPQPSRKAEVEKSDNTELARDIQRELDRVGCSAGRPDGIWGARTREALQKFARYARVKLDSDEPSQKALTAVKKHRKRVCHVVTRRSGDDSDRSRTRYRGRDEYRDRYDDRREGRRQDSGIDAGSAIGIGVGSALWRFRFRGH